MTVHVTVCFLLIVHMLIVLLPFPVRIKPCMMVLHNMDYHHDVVRTGIDALTYDDKGKHSQKTGRRAHLPQAKNGRTTHEYHHAQGGRSGEVFGATTFWQGQRGCTKTEHGSIQRRLPLTQGTDTSTGTKQNTGK